ncbi:hypothetical protein [Streptomyces sp. V3I7]
MQVCGARAKMRHYRAKGQKGEGSSAMAGGHDARDAGPAE